MTDISGFVEADRVKGSLSCRVAAQRWMKGRRVPSREGSCEKIENRLLPALSVRRSARSTQVERALRARFHLWIRRRDGSGLAQFNFFTASGDLAAIFFLTSRRAPAVLGTLKIACRMWKALSERRPGRSYQRKIAARRAPPTFSSVVAPHRGMNGSLAKAKGGKRD